MLGILGVFKGVVGQGYNTLGKSKYTRVEYIKVVITKSKYTIVKVVILRIEFIKV